MFQFIWFYCKNFHLLHSSWKLAHLQARINKISKFTKKLEKLKIFRYIGKFSFNANISIHQILEQNYPIFPNWKIFHLHPHWNFALSRPGYIKCLDFRERWQIRKVPDLSEKFAPLQIFQLNEKAPRDTTIWTLSSLEAFSFATRRLGNIP